MIKKVATMAVGMLLLMELTVSADTKGVNLPYETYLYDLNNEPVAIQASYAPFEIVTGETAGVSGFRDISDMAYDNDNKWLYVADTGNQRVVALDEDYHVTLILDSFETEGTPGTFDVPSGVCIRDQRLYVADTGNQRILCFDKTSGKLIKEFSRPEVRILDEDYLYEPIRLSVDIAGRMYVIAKGINQGLMYLDEEGAFLNFMGAPQVTPNYLDLLWRNFMTEEQIENSKKIVPTEYNSVAMDDKGFLYVSSQSADVPPIARLNSQGTDVLKYREDQYPAGDGWYVGSDGKPVSSTFVDAAIGENGTYFGLDTARGRVFAYTREGELLYAFGSLGSQNGTFYSPSCIECCDDRLLIADKSKGTIVIFRQTQFGSQVDQAFRTMLSGDYTRSRAIWQEVVRDCPSYYPAYLSLARIYIQNKEYKEALTNLEMLNETDYYAIAFREYRSQIVHENFTWIVLAVLLAIGVLIIVPRLLRRIPAVQHIAGSPLWQEYRYSTYCIFHPFDGFWDIKREHRGSRRTAIILFTAFIVLYALNSQFTGYGISGKRQEDVTVLLDLATVLIPLLLWSLSNWCFTTLMDGEGNLSDIFVATAYALKPYILFGIPLLLLSQILAANEAFIYTTFQTIVVIWVLALLFFGMMVTHDYSLGKALVALLLTLVGICLMIFLALIFFNILQEMILFFENLYRELAFRLY